MASVFHKYKKSVKNYLIKKHHWPNYEAAIWVSRHTEFLRKRVQDNQNACSTARLIHINEGNIGS